MTSPKRRTSPNVYITVSIRSEGTCECVEKNHGHIGRCCSTWYLEYAHIKHRKMGGTTDPEVHCAENVRHLCKTCHDYLDHRRY